MNNNIKTIILFWIIFMGHANAQINFGSLLQKAEDAGGKVAADKGPDLAKEAEAKILKKKSSPDSSPKDSAALVAQSEAGLKQYAAYDFIPGEKILFEDHFTDEQVGEFPSQWELSAGQAEIRTWDGAKAIAITSGKYGRVGPQMKSPKYLTDTFAVEFDYFLTKTKGGPEAAPLIVFLRSAAGYDATVTISKENVVYDDGHGTRLSNDMHMEMKGDTFAGRWHHIALSCRSRHLKVYVDQYRTLLVPDTKVGFVSMEIGGAGDENAPVIFGDFRISSGGRVHMAGAKFTDAKMITHGIGFDSGHTTLRPESMGVLNMVAQVMKDNPDLKFEIGVHADSDGDAIANLTLSQRRAESIKARLVKMGIADTRLMAKGYGMAKPVTDNDSSLGKANNRRVEFAKM